jgi:hypothetical protein
MHGNGAPAPPAVDRQHAVEAQARAAEALAEARGQRDEVRQVSARLRRLRDDEFAAAFLRAMGGDRP